MEKKNKKDSKEEISIKIDYEDIDVADIMGQIKRKIAKEAEKPSPGESLKEEPALTPPSPPQFQEEPDMEEEEVSGFKKKAKRILLKLMKPFTPLIKLMILPVHEQILETMRHLHQTNKRLDFIHAKLERRGDEIYSSLTNRLDEAIPALHERIDKLSEALSSRINKDFEKTNKKIGQVSQTINKRMNVLFADLAKTMEYTKLLHSLSHNMVVEFSKLKIEEENLKNKTRIMEKDFEFLGKREKALEKLILK